MLPHPFCRMFFRPRSTGTPYSYPGLPTVDVQRPELSRLWEFFSGAALRLFVKTEPRLGYPLFSAFVSIDGGIAVK